MTKNEVRAAQTKGRLIAVARARFGLEGYADTATEAILEEAGVKRGALYHHFRDKAELFEAVCHELAAEAALAIEARTQGLTDPINALQEGAMAWIDYVARPEVHRILVVDALSVLGREKWEELDRDRSFRMLRDGVGVAIETGAIRFSSGGDALAVLLNGAMNQIAIRMAGADTELLKSGFAELLQALARSSR